MFRDLSLFEQRLFLPKAHWNLISGERSWRKKFVPWANSFLKELAPQWAFFSLSKLCCCRRKCFLLRVDPIFEGFCLQWSNKEVTKTVCFWKIAGKHQVYLFILNVCFGQMRELLSVIYAKCFKCRTPSCIGLLIDQLIFRPVDSGLLYYSQLSLSRTPRDSLKYIEIPVLRHIRFPELRKTIWQPNVPKSYVIWLLLH